MKLKDGFVIRTIGSDTVAIYAGENTVDLQQAIFLNETAEYIFRLLLEETNESNLISALIKRYDISEQQAQNDVKAFVSALGVKGYLI